MKIDARGYSPRVLEKIVTAGGELKSNALAARMLKLLAGVSVSHTQVGRLTQQIGEELQSVRELQTLQHRHAELTPKIDAPIELACVEVDGGRIHTRASGRARGVHDPAWKETKIGCLMRMTSETFPDDPHPELPRCFADRKQVDALLETLSDETPQESPAKTRESARTASPGSSSCWRPRRLFRTCVATLEGSARFGQMLAAEAQRRGFYEAQRQAFVADGQAYNWKIQQAQFPHFVPIVDFVHAVQYTHRAAGAIGKTPSEHWSRYLHWANVCWQGGVDEVIAELSAWLQKQPPPQPDEDLSDDDPRRIVRKTITYLTNNRDRMQYPRYRRDGLPTTSALIESLVKEFNYRVKGSEKFWNRPQGAETILQIRAALLSDDNRLSRHIHNRPGSMRRPYKTAVI